LKEILTELFNYMKEHFSNEEDYMQEIHYPYLNEHKIMHKISFVICLILYKT
ncbi:chemotaxis protein, partial [Campylobacter jejuni]|nr:chemotaxis protein [Campylobacter jejuni]